MRGLFASLILLSALAATPAWADPPPGYEYKISAPLGRGFPVCDTVWGALLRHENKYYLDYGPGDAMEEPFLGQRPTLLWLNAYPTVATPNWRNMHLEDIRRDLPKTLAALGQQGKFLTQDYGIQRAHVDLDGDNHGEDIYALYWLRSGDFPRLFTTDDKPELNKALEDVHANYTFNFGGVNYVAARERGFFRVFQIASDHGKHGGAGPQLIVQKVCEYASNVPQPGTNGTALGSQPLDAGKNYK